MTAKPASYTQLTTKVVFDIHLISMVRTMMLDAAMELVPRLPMPRRITPPESRLPAGQLRNPGRAYFEQVNERSKP